MTIEKRLICSVDPELAKPLGIDPDNRCAHAINLSLECVRREASDPSDTEDTAWGIFNAFLDRLHPDGNGTRKVYMQLFRLVNADSEKPSLEWVQEIQEIDHKVADTPMADRTKSLMKWLEDRKKSEPYWLLDAGSGNKDRPVDTDSVQAAHYLRASHIWNAPLPHRHGLTHLVITDQPGTEQHVLLPYFVSEKPARTPAITRYDAAQPELGLEVLYDPGASGLLGGEWAAVTQFLSSVNLEPFGDWVQEDGFLAADEAADDTRRLLERLEDRSATLFSAGAALSSVPIKGLLSSFEQTDLKAVAWFTVTSLYSLLDSFLLALRIKQAANLNPALSGFQGAVLDRIQDLQADERDALVDIDEHRLNKAIYSTLGASRLYVQSSEDRKAQARALRHALSLPDLDDAESPGMEIILKLLNAWEDEVSLEFELLDPEHRDYEVILPLIIEALGEIEVTLHQEAGAETAIVRIFETVEEEKSDGRKDASNNALQWRRNLAKNLASDFAGDWSDDSGSVETALQQVIDGAWNDYRKLLDSNFDGGVAVRQTMGMLYAQLASTDCSRDRDAIKTGLEKLLKKLQERLEEAAWFKKRLALSSEDNGAFQPLLKHLRTAGAATDFGVDDEALAKIMDEAWKNTLKELAQPLGKEQRFVPDLVPAPLPIRIARSMNPTEADAFSNYFNGVGVLLRRPDSSKWAHANLADLTYKTVEVGDKVDFNSHADIAPVVSPMSPGLGGKAAMFVNYSGYPLTSSAFDDTQVLNEGPGSERAFYKIDAHEGYDSFEKLPQLAYGTTIETAAFTCSNAGTMPAPLADSKKPWLPEAKIAEYKVPATTHRIERRTAIGRLTLKETGPSQRLGHIPADVQPLFHDYPRRALVSTAAADGVLDTHRRADGSGTLETPDKEITEHTIILNALAAHAGPGQLTVAVHQDATVTPKTPANLNATVELNPKHSYERLEIRIKAENKKLKLTLRLVSANGNIESADDDIERGSGIEDDLSAEPFWLRFRLTGSPAACSFELPTSGDESGEGSAEDEPLLLLAPDDPTAWSSGLGEFKAEVEYPRVTYSDMERWYANRTLREAAGIGANGLKNKDLPLALLTAYIARDISEPLADALEHMPDPAVRNLLVEVAPVDQLTANDPQSGDLSLMLPVPGLGDVIGDYQLPEKPSLKDLNEQLIRKIQENFKMKLVVKSSGKTLEIDESSSNNQPPTVTISVPAGMSARITISPVVNADLFDKSDDKSAAVLHDRHLELAERKTADGKQVVFRGASLVVESMLDVMAELEREEAKAYFENLAGSAIRLQPARAARQYDAVARSPGEPLQRKRWRALSGIKVHSQRWRFSGRPIYHWFDPKCGNLVTEPLIDLTGIDDKDRRRFEEEAFNDRDDLDAATVNQRLNAAEADTVLETFRWNEPSATFFRHRFSLVMRYAGALRNVDHRQVQAWPQDGQEQYNELGWTHRMVVLADRSGVELTRPQVRATLPLTSAPRQDKSTGVTTPPLMVFLHEPPFAVGGLAERVCAELKTGYGYAPGRASPISSTGAETGEYDKTLLFIKDSRKEIGPDPRLTYQPLNSDEIYGMALQVEGPIGLTFDDPNVPAPSLPNTAYHFVPVNLASDPDLALEEHFAGVSVRRYLDPRWTVDSISQAKIADTDVNRDLNHAWWIELGNSDTTVEILSEDPDAEKVTLLEAKREDNMWNLKFSKAALDEYDSTGEFVEIARALVQKNKEIALLHTPLQGGRYSLSIFGPPGDSDQNAGKSNLRVLLTTVEWSLAHSSFRAAGSLSQLGADNATLIREGSASEATAMNWTRTGRNFDFITANRKNADSEPERLDYANLIATVTNEGKLKFSEGEPDQGDGLWLRNSLSTRPKPYPLHVHRHLVALTTRWDSRIGNPIESYYRAARLIGRQATLPESVERADVFVRVAEIETPAQILCQDNLDGVPATYKTAYMDLRSSKGENVNSYRIIIRVVGGPNYLNKLSGFTLNLQSGAQNQPSKDVKLAFEKKDMFPVSIELAINNGTHGEGKESITPIVMYSDGSVQELDAFPNTGLNLGTADGLWLRLKDVAGGLSEVWCDISLLHSQYPMNLPEFFDFNWLFSAVTEKDQAKATSVKGLHHMVEAQARLVSLSPAIPVVHAK